MGRNPGAATARTDRLRGGLSTAKEDRAIATGEKTYAEYRENKTELQSGHQANRVAEGNRCCNSRARVVCILVTAFRRQQTNRECFLHGKKFEGRNDQRYTVFDGFAVTPDRDRNPDRSPAREPALCMWLTRHFSRLQKTDCRAPWSSQPA